MQTVILPGGSVKNKAWLDECAKEIQIDGIVRAVSWDHWADPEQKFEPKEKAMLIARHARGDKINIIAKSIGSLVAAYIIEEVPDQINKVIICGIPLNDISASEKATIKTALSTLDKSRLICFQNESDPHGTFDEVRDFLPQEVAVLSKPRDDHHYPFYGEFSSFLNS